eukprot:9197052-Prorocentrum_lima.AAC.1
MNEARPSDTPKTGEDEPFIRERDTFEDQLLKVLHETSMPVLEDQVAQVDKRLVSEMKVHIRNGYIPKRRDCPICQQAQGPVVRNHQRPT